MYGVCYNFKNGGLERERVQMPELACSVFIGGPEREAEAGGREEEKEESEQVGFCHRA